jgi:hypothetical protein
MATFLKWALVVGILTSVPVQAWGTQAWVLWVEAPVGSDQWSLPNIVEPKFKDKAECDRRAQHLNDVEASVAKMERVGDDSRDVFTCLPDTVDPRPESALR